MSITAEEKVASFEAELEMIFNKTVREFTRLCIIHAPDYFFEDCPSSSSGKYHPLDEISSDGTIIHTRKVFAMACELVKGLDCEGNRDLVLAATIIHDLRKQGTGNGVGHTIKEHPDLAAKLVDEVQQATLILNDEQYIIIRNCVGFHYGPWSAEPWKKSIEEYTREELAVYLSDFVVSKRFIHTEYRRHNYE